MSENLLLIDGHSILNRAFYGVPDLTNVNGLHTNAIYGFLNMMFKAIEEEQPDYLAVAFDLKAPTFRHKMYEEYKGTRKPMPQELYQQVDVMKEVLRAMDITIVEMPGYEADDILGTMAKKGEQEEWKVVILSEICCSLQPKIQLFAFLTQKVEQRRWTILMRVEWKRNISSLLPSLLM